MNFWFPFTTGPNKERPAAQRLSERGVLVNVPLEKRQIRVSDGHGGRKRISEFRPAWTGYVFVYMPDDWREIKRIMEMEFPGGDRCVRGLVRFGPVFAKITDEAMKWGLQQLKEISEATTVKQLPLQVSETVEAKGRVGTVQMIQGERVTILTEMFNRSVLAVVSVHDVKRVTPDEKTPATTGGALQCGANQSTRYARDVGRSATGEVSRNR